eukprot:NP_491904.2 TetraSPanin family [Caenorhabditis elegans]
MFSRRRRGHAGTDEEIVKTEDAEPEPFEEMYSVFRIVALYEMLIHGQWKYMANYLSKKRTQLVLGMYIGAAFELVRFVCALVIAIVLILLRMSVLLPLYSDSIIGNLSWICEMNYLAFWIALIVFGLIVIQFTVYQCRNPTYVVISTSINFIFSIILITALIHTVILKDNKEAFLKEGLHKKTLFSGTMSEMRTYQARMKCCGVEGADDYSKSHIMTYVNPCSYNPNSLTLSNPKTPFSKLQTPTITGGKISVFYKGLSYLKLTNKTIRVPVTREFSIYEYHFYSIPMSCCRKFDGVVCSQRNLTSEETQEVRKYAEVGKWDLMLKYFVMPELGLYWSRGCLTEYVDSIETYITVLISTLVIFALFTALTIGFVIVLLLYEDGIGHIVSDTKMFGVERNTGVHFLMSLDMMNSDFQDDFSLIEFLRNTDIDRFVAGDKLGDTINGRKDAEKA